MINEKPARTTATASSLSFLASSSIPVFFIHLLFRSVSLTSCLLVQGIAIDDCAIWACNFFLPINRICRSTFPFFSLCRCFNVHLLNQFSLLLKLEHLQATSLDNYFCCASVLSKERRSKAWGSMLLFSWECEVCTSVRIIDLKTLTLSYLRVVLFTVRPSIQQIRPHTVVEVPFSFSICERKETQFDHTFSHVRWLSSPAINSPNPSVSCVCTISLILISIYPPKPASASAHLLQLTNTFGLRPCQPLSS